MSNDEIGDIFAGGAPSVKFPAIGAMVKGKITDLSVQQSRNIKDGSPEHWPDGNPKKVLVLTIQTDEKNDADDDGKRRLFASIPGGVLTALRVALSAAKADKPEVGGKIAVAYTSDGERTNPAFDPPKVYTAKYVKPDPADEVFVTPEQPVADVPKAGADASAAQAALDSLDF